MSFPFAATCTDLLHLAGLPPQAPAQDENGALHLSFELNDTVVQMLCENEASTRPLSRVIFGAGEETESEEFWRSLLAANTQMVMGNGPVASRDGDTGDVIFQQAFAAGVSAQDVFRSVCALTSLASCWRSGRIDAGAAMWHHRPLAADRVHAPAVREATARIGRLCSDIDAHYGCDAITFAMSPPAASTMALWEGEQEFQVIWLPQDPFTLHVFGTIGPCGEPSSCSAARLAEVNEWLLAEPNSAVVCARDATDEYVLHTSLELHAEHCAPRLVEMARRQARAIASIRSHLREMT